MPDNHASRMPRSILTGQNCTIIFTDVTGFGDETRTDENRKNIRLSLYLILQFCLECSGISWKRCHVEDRGDGVLVIVPPTFPTISVLEPFLPYLGRALVAYNMGAEEAEKIELRVALTVGPVESDTHGVNGQAIIEAARLLDAPALKKRVKETGTHLAVMASDFVYSNLIRNRDGEISAIHFQRVPVRVKQYRGTGWMYPSP